MAKFGRLGTGSRTTRPSTTNPPRPRGTRNVNLNPPRPKTDSGRVGLKRAFFGRGLETSGQKARPRNTVAPKPGGSLKGSGSAGPSKGGKEALRKFEAQVRRRTPGRMEQVALKRVPAKPFTGTPKERQEGEDRRLAAAKAQRISARSVRKGSSRGGLVGRGGRL